MGQISLLSQSIEKVLFLDFFLFFVSIVLNTSSRLAFHHALSSQSTQTVLEQPISEGEKGTATHGAVHQERVTLLLGQFHKRNSAGEFSENAPGLLALLKGRGGVGLPPRSRCSSDPPLRGHREELMGLPLGPACPTAAQTRIAFHLDSWRWGRRGATNSYRRNL